METIESIKTCTCGNPVVLRYGVGICDDCHSAILVSQEEADVTDYTWLDAAPQHQFDRCSVCKTTIRPNLQSFWHPLLDEFFCSDRCYMERIA